MQMKANCPLLDRSYLHVHLQRMGVISRIMCKMSEKLFSFLFCFLGFF